MKKKTVCLLLAVCVFLFNTMPSEAAISDLTQDERDMERMQLYRDMDTITGVPWYWLAAIDSYERGLMLPVMIAARAKVLFPFISHPGIGGRIKSRSRR
ncbi:hypothetical protein [Geomicrobium sp. JCM 19037]|uniref:hypothetical protein n=1 Tax=Geomicrobium sp. JCM 19037 TaxID=1460634 RepID=UPI0026B2588F|nr:hypothetical protein [Geomicrobium sp. JCM 19037]